MEDCFEVYQKEYKDFGPQLCPRLSEQQKPASSAECYSSTLALWPSGLDVFEVLRLEPMSQSPCANDREKRSGCWVTVNRSIGFHTGVVIH